MKLADINWRSLGINVKTVSPSWDGFKHVEIRQPEVTINTIKHENVDDKPGMLELKDNFRTF